jgi:hypothetical protein
MPPGWSHTGNHKTAKLVRKEFFKKVDADSLVITMQQEEKVS